jgi:hypothetical protein
MTPTDICDYLTASGPFDEYAEKMMVYGQFIGSWDMDAVWYDRSGGQKTGKGEWHFGWILGGRGIQDVLFAAGAPSHKYGTTLRCYDVELDVWHVTWMQPYGGEFVNLMGRKMGDRIVNESIGPDTGRLLRWSFNDIKPDSFLWLGEVSTDNGVTWFLEQRMLAKRSGH